MTLSVLEQVWDPDSVDNADWFHVGPEAVVLLDGAAPREPEPVSAHVNDAVWLVRRFVELFESGALARDLEQRAEWTRQLLEQEYRALCASAGRVPKEAPFACLGVASESAGRLELLNMGDLTFLVEKADGSVERFGESAVRALDRQALAELERQMAEGPSSHAERVAQVWPQIQQNRALRNVLPGYDVLEPGVCLRGRMQRASFRRGDVRSLLLVSDGFYRLVDTYQRYTDSALLRALRRTGLRDLLQELRSIEIEDAACVRHPRFKQHDDATALWLE